MRPCIYISGPMTGYPDLNFPAFNRAANALRAVGFPVINPADFGVTPNETWAECLKRDIHVLVSCQQVVTLDGWQQSKGARLECHVANELGIPVTSFFEFALGVAKCSTDSSDDFLDGSATGPEPSPPTTPSPITSACTTDESNGKQSNAPDPDWYIDWINFQLGSHEVTGKRVFQNN